MSIKSQEEQEVDERVEAIRRMRARRSMASRREDKFPVTGPWSFRGLCEHEHGWRNVDEYWLQCRLCWWCKPKLGKPPTLRVLPAMLKGRVLPPLSGKVDLHSVYRNAGFIIDDDRDSVLSMVRVTVVQYSWSDGVRRCGADVRFKDYGWQRVAVFNETALFRLLDVLAKAEPRKPKTLWLAIQKVYTPGWQKPWEAT